MPIIPTEPFVIPEVPAVPEKTYPIMWLVSMNIIAPDPNQDVTLDAQLAPMRVLEDGSKELAPQELWKSYKTEELFKLAATDEQIATVMSGLLSALERKAKEEKLI